MKNLIIIFSIFIFTSSFISFELCQKQISYVPDEETAIKVAEAIWLPIYGKNIYLKQPFTAKLIKNKIWRVEGSMGSDDVGGVPIIEIQKKDCKILLITHTK